LGGFSRDLSRQDRICSVKEISEAEEIPVKYLEKIILKLAKASLVATKRGSGGGYYLARPAGQISVDDVVQILEKTTSPAPCVERDYHCPRSCKCPTRGIWTRIDQSIRSTLSGITLQDL
jgi:Rrf2 family iron-sulfur cluster assembly transcriptional regulator